VDDGPGISWHILGGDAHGGPEATVQGRVSPGVAAVLQAAFAASSGGGGAATAAADAAAGTGTSGVSRGSLRHLRRLRRGLDASNESTRSVPLPDDEGEAGPDEIPFPEVDRAGVDRPVRRGGNSNMPELHLDAIADLPELLRQSMAQLRAVVPGASGRLATAAIEREVDRRNGQDRGSADA
jgi:hypothetical protein